MMDTKYIGGTIKSEALHLLSMDSLTDIECHRINVLTANQQGFDIYDDLVENGLRDYATSVDECLMLPVPDGLCWLLSPESPTNRAGAYLVPEKLPEGEDHYHAGLAVAFGIMKLTPLAMLKAFWQLQPD